VHDGTVFIHVFVGDVDVTFLQPLLYLESLEVQGVDVYFAERFPHPMSSVWTVPRVVDVDERCDNHADVVSVRNVSELLFDDEQGLTTVLLVFQRLETWSSQLTDETSMSRFQIVEQI
jgi:hypothetical protein